jgi:hypothetical protein
MRLDQVRAVHRILHLRLFEITKLIAGEGSIFLAVAIYHPIEGTLYSVRFPLWRQDIEKKRTTPGNGFYPEDTPCRSAIAQKPAENAAIIRPQIQQA